MIGRSVALGAWGALALAANLLTPLWGDDWCLSGLPSFAAVLDEVWQTYLQWTGRAPAMLVVQSALGPAGGTVLPWLELANAGAFVLLLWSLVRLAETAWGGEPSHGFAAGFALPAMTGLVLWWLPESIAEAAFWKTAAVMYLWSVAAAAFLLERALAWRAGAAPGRMALAGFAVFALPAAMLLEIVSLPVAAGLGWIAWRAPRSTPGARAAMVLAVAYGLGTVAVVAAPGNLGRAAAFAELPPADWLRFWIWFLRRAFDPLTLATLAGVLAAWLAFGRGRQALALRVALPFLLLIAAGLAIASQLPPRALTGRVAFPISVALCGLLAALVIGLRPGPTAWRAMALVLGLVLLPATAAIALRDMERIAAVQRAWPAEAAAQAGTDPAAAEVALSFPFAHPWMTRRHASKHRFYIALSPDPADNACIARALGVGAVRAVP